MPGEEWTLRAKTEAGILFVEARGEASIRSLKVLRSFVAAELQHEDVQAIVIDFRETTTTMEAFEWVRNAEEARRSQIGLPVAMVVLEKHFELVAQHCMTVAAAGLRRMVFTEPFEAAGWARRQASRAFGRAAPKDPMPSTSSSRLRLVQ